MEAGCELDALIAEKVMGWTLRISDDRDDAYSQSWLSGPNILTDSRFVFEFEPSTDIAHAWLVVDKLIADGCRVDVVRLGPTHPWTCEVWRGPWRVLDHAEAAPLAICRAALAYHR